MKEKFSNKEVPEMEENRAEALRNELFMKNEHVARWILDLRTSIFILINSNVID